MIVALRRVALAMIIAGLLGVAAYPALLGAVTEAGSTNPQIVRIAWVLLGAGVAAMIIVARAGRSRAHEPDEPTRERSRPETGKDTSNIGRRVPLDRTEPAPERPKRRWGRGDPD